MRVIGGTFGGRRLRAVEGHGTRPTSDRVREALFSRIEARYGLGGAWVLDVFAGTGALAIEAVSRGAAGAVCVETGKKALETLRGNLRELGLDNRVRVMDDDFKRALARLAVKWRYHGILLDPPYGKGLAVDALRVVTDLGLLRPGGWISVEVGRREQLPEAFEGPQATVARVREDAYGDTLLALYEARAHGTRHRGDEGSRSDPENEGDEDNEDAGNHALPAAEAE